jgi:hypothetical protein
MMNTRTTCRIVAGILLFLLIGAATARGDVVRERPPRTIQHLSAETKQKLGAAVREKMAQARKMLQEFRDKHPEMAPSEVDLRTDFGFFELGLDPTDPSGEPQLTEITLKNPSTGVEISLGCEGPWHSPEFNGKLRIGIAIEKSAGPAAVEYKSGGEIDLNRTIDDLYDGEWQKRSEWKILSLTEQFLARFDFYVGGAAGAGNTSINTGIEVTYSLRDANTEVQFREMFQSFDRLARAQDRYAQWRKKKVDAEARRVGADPTGKNFNQVMKAIKARYALYPSLERKVFRKKPGGLTFQGLVSDWYCTNRPVVTMHLALPKLIERGIPLFWKKLGDLIPPPPPPPGPPKRPVQDPDRRR